MGLFDIFSNHSAGFDDGFKNGIGGYFGQYQGAIDNAYGPQAYQNGQARYTEGLDHALRGQDAAGYGRLAQSGMRDTSNGGGLYGLTRAQGVAGHGADLFQHLNEGRANAYGNLYDAYLRQGQFFHHDAHEGLGSKLLGAAASYYGAGAGGMGAMGAGGNAANGYFMGGMGTDPQFQGGSQNPGDYANPDAVSAPYTQAAQAYGGGPGLPYRSRFTPMKAGYGY